MLSVVVLVGLLAAIVVPPLRTALDQAATDEGAERYAAAHEEARALAQERGRLTRLVLDSVTRSATLSVRGDTGWEPVRTLPLGPARVAVSQETITFSPLGLGFGASNSRIVFSRGAAAETITVSRTARLRRS
jgi:type II secretory pathway pseudopilin PulG